MSYVCRVLKICSSNVTIYEEIQETLEHRPSKTVKIYTPTLQIARLSAKSIPNLSLPVQRGRRVDVRPGQPRAHRDSRIGLLSSAWGRSITIEDVRKNISLGGFH